MSSIKRYCRVICRPGPGRVMNIPINQPVPSSTITPTAAFTCLCRGGWGHYIIIECYCTLLAKHKEIFYFLEKKYTHQIKFFVGNLNVF